MSQKVVPWSLFDYYIAGSTHRFQGQAALGNTTEERLAYALGLRSESLMTKEVLESQIRQIMGTKEE